MMAQNEVVVVGIDVAKDKVDACIRSLSQRHTFPNTAQGHRKMIALLHKHKVSKVVMEASGGFGVNGNRNIFRKNRTTTRQQTARRANH